MDRFRRGFLHDGGRTPSDEQPRGSISRFPKYWMRYADLLIEMKSQTIQWNGVREMVYSNPTKSNLLALFERFKLMRGLTDGKDIYVWDAHKLVHMQVIDAFKDFNPNFACDIYSFDKMFFIGRPDDMDDEGKEWIFNNSQEIAPGIFVFSETFKLLDTITAYRRMTRR